MNVHLCAQPRGACNFHTIVLPEKELDAVIYIGDADAVGKRRIRFRDVLGVKAHAVVSDEQVDVLSVALALDLEQTVSSLWLEPVEDSVFHNGLEQELDSIAAANINN